MDLKNRAQIEVEFAAKLSRLQTRHRAELANLIGFPPDITRVPADFWGRVEQESQQDVTATLILIFVRSAVQHAGDAFAVAAESRANAWASKQGRTLAANMASNVQQRLQHASRRWEQITQRVATGGAPLAKSDVASALSDILGEIRAESIAITETTAAASAGSEAAIADTIGLSEADTWYTASDQRVCPICSPLHGTPRPFWSRFFPAGPGAHPRCRCWIQYANEKVLAGVRR